MSNSETVSQNASPSRSGKNKWSTWKRWGVVLGTLLLLFVVANTFASGWISSWFSTGEDASLRFVSPTFGRFVHEIAVRGDISSSSNVDIKCQVRSSGGVMILSVIPEGTEVKAGDELAKLDDSTLIDNRVSQINTVSQSEAELATAKNNLRTAEIAKKEYEEGSYRLSLQQLESSIIAAQEEVNRLKEYLEHSKKLYAKGFITKSQLDADDFAYRQAELNLTAAELEKKVLEEYTHEKQSIAYDSDINTANANMLAKENVHNQNLAKLKDIEQQIENCTIVAPADGKVLYVNETRGFGNNQEFIVAEGSSVRERQTFLRLPDPNKLQVIADVHEGKINYIKRGQTVVVRTDATGERDIRGTVVKVDELPQPTNHWMGNVKEYRVTIAIESSPGVLPGMTADTKILVSQKEGVLMVPTHTIFEHGGKYYCIVRNGSRLEPRVVQLGESNDKVVIVESGITRTDRLLSAAFDHREKVSLPELQEGQSASASIRPQVEKETEEASAVQPTRDADGKIVLPDRKVPRRRGPRDAGMAGGEGSGELPSLPEGMP
ncbi:MAG: efflux RND transporter periplasmic adaptor subunit, partial [Planctomycetia bacterium]|nr:efflux RND transporter periplasmic adaptor subunit [Planctomycetia bacterium]